MTIQSTLKTGLIVGRFGVGVADGPDADDEPDVIPAGGQVTFTPTVTRLPNPLASPAPLTVLRVPTVAILDDEGYICTPDPTNPNKAGQRGLRLFATNDEDSLVTDWTYRVEYAFNRANGVVPMIDAHDMALPAGSTRDLTDVVPVPSTPGHGIAQSEAAADEARQSASDARASAALAVENSDTAKLLAGEAKTASAAAVTTSDEAKATADEAKAAATQAVATAGEAKLLAGEAQASAAATVEIAEGAGASATQAEAAVMRAEGHAERASSIAEAILPEAKSASEAAVAARNEASAFRDQTEQAVTAGLEWSGTIDVPADAPRMLHATLTGDTVLNLPSLSDARAFTVSLALTQDATGGHQVMIWNGHTANSSAFNHTGAADSTDVVHLIWTGRWWLITPAAQNVGVA